MNIYRGLIAITISSTSIAPAMATAVMPATDGVSFSAFDVGTQGTLLASKSVAAQGLTFAGVTNLAVYQNAIGTLDFYYQFIRTGAGTSASDAVEKITGGNFSNYLVDAFSTDADIDGGGIFTASDNAGAAATAGRSLSGGVLAVNFAPSNPVADSETSATYIFRTDATKFVLGTFGVIDGSTISGQGYQPASSAVPEPSSWALMVIGFGGLGMAMRGGRARKAHGQLPRNVSPHI